MIEQSDIIIEPFSDSLKNKWDQFIEEEAINSTFLHSRKFYDHDPLNAPQDSSLIFYKKHRIIAVFPAIVYVQNGQRILHSHPRATYGGVVVNKDVNVEIALQLVELIICFARQKKVERIIVRNPFRIFHTLLCDETDYALWFYGFEIASRELEIVIPIFGSLPDLKSRYHTTTARNVKKALNSVDVFVSSDFKGYWLVLEKCLLQRHSKNPVHSYNSIMKLRENVSEDKVILFGAYHNNKLIAGIVVFYLVQFVLHAQYIASDFEFQHLNPVHAIIDYIIGWGNNRGIKYFNLGMANEDQGHKINANLFRFKQSFGGRGLLRETMFLNLELPSNLPKL